MSHYALPLMTRDLFLGNIFFVSSSSSPKKFIQVFASSLFRFHTKNVPILAAILIFAGTERVPRGGLAGICYYFVQDFVTI